MAQDATGTPTALGIPKYNVAVDAPSGLGFNATMDALDALLTTITGATSSVKHVLPSAIKDYPTDGTKALFGDGTWQVPVATDGQLDYNSQTSNVAISATTEGTANAVVTGNSISYTGARIKVTFWAPGAVITGTNGNVMKFVLLRDSTVLGVFNGPDDGTNSAARVAIAGIYFDTPTAAAHTYAVKAYCGNATGTVLAGAGGTGAYLPAFIQVSRT